MKKNEFIFCVILFYSLTTLLLVNASIIDKKSNENNFQF